MSLSHFVPLETLLNSLFTPCGNINTQQITEWKITKYENVMEYQRYQMEKNKQVCQNCSTPDATYFRTAVISSAAIPAYYFHPPCACSQTVQHIWQLCFLSSNISDAAFAAKVFCLRWYTWAALTVWIHFHQHHLGFVLFQRERRT